MGEEDDVPLIFILIHPRGLYSGVKRNACQSAQEIRMERTTNHKGI